jgi:uncharacterized protein (TIGR02996 family)
MSHLSGFLQAILEDPADDSARLIFADWLEEQDGPALAVRGEFFRVQCRLAAWEPDLERRTQFQKRQTELLEAHRVEWLGPLARNCSYVRFERGLPRVTLAAKVVAVPRFAAVAAELLRLAWVERVRLSGVGREVTAAALSPALAEVIDLDLSDNALDDATVAEVLSRTSRGRCAA